MADRARRRIALAALTIPDADPLEFVQIAADAGFDAVGLCLRPSAQMAAPLADDAALRHDVRRALDDRGLDVLEVGVFRLAADTAVAGFMPALEIGAALGARFATACGSDNADERIAGTFHEFNAAAKKCGMRAVLEFVPYFYPRDLGQAREIVAGTGDGAGICIDVLHFYRSGSHVSDVAGMDPALFPYLQFCDAGTTSRPATTIELMREARTDRRYPGEGALPLAELLDALPHDVPLSIESPCQAHRHVPPAARAQLVAAATRRFLESYGSRG